MQLGARIWLCFESGPKGREEGGASVPSLRAAESAGLVLPPYLARADTSGQKKPGSGLSVLRGEEAPGFLTPLLLPTQASRCFQGKWCLLHLPLAFLLLLFKLEGGHVACGPKISDEDCLTPFSRILPELRRI